MGGGICACVCALVDRRGYKSANAEPSLHRSCTAETNSEQNNEAGRRMNSQQQVLVIDNGSFMIKAGFADSDAPEAITVPPVVTTPPLPPPPRVSPPAEDVPASVFDFPTSVVFGEEAVRRARKPSL